MNLVKLGPTVVLNMDSVASITWDRSGEELVAVVKYLTAAPMGSGGEPSLVWERLAGDAAHALYNWIEQRSAGAMGEMRAETRRGATAGRRPQQCVPARQFLDMLTLGLLKKKAWYYLKDANHRPYFVAMVNAKGSCSMRTFDALTGRFLGKQYASGKFQEQFGQYLKNAKELHIDRQPNLEIDCREQLPEEVLSSFKKQMSLK